MNHSAQGVRADSGRPSIFDRIGEVFKFSSGSISEGSTAIAQVGSEPQGSRADSGRPSIFSRMADVLVLSGGSIEAESTDQNQRTSVSELNIDRINRATDFPELELDSMPLPELDTVPEVGEMGATNRPLFGPIDYGHSTEDPTSRFDENPAEHGEQSPGGEEVVDNTPVSDPGSSTDSRKYSMPSPEMIREQQRQADAFADVLDEAAEHVRRYPQPLPQDRPEIGAFPRQP